MSTAEAQRFKGLIEPHLDALFRAAFRLARHKADAEDLVQETCVRAYLRIGELHESQPVKAWLLRVLHNVFVDGARRARRYPVTMVHDDMEPSAPACPEPNPEERAGMTQREEQLHRAWLKLDRGHRALLALRAEGYTLTEIAEITRLEADALNSRLYRARVSLARHLNEERGAETGIELEIAK